ncbi:MAG: alpha/beta hydrolase [Pseudomonadota bacterium]
MLRRFRHEMADGLVCGIEIGDPIRSIDALFLHATGFNAMTYQSLLGPLGLRARVAALDLRGHGRTSLPAKPPFASWGLYRNDVIDWLDKHAPHGVVLGGHSMGGAVSLMVAGKRPDLVKALVLSDPVIIEPSFYRARHIFPFVHRRLSLRKGLAADARRRRAEFQSRLEARLSYESKAAFSTWRDPFLQDYLLDGLHRIDDNHPDGEDQTWRLTCEPKWEAATFNAQRNRPWGALSVVRKKGIPISVLVADKGSVMTDKSIDRLARRVPHAKLRRVGGTTHFLPMEAPYAVRDEFSQYLSRLIEGFSMEEEGPVKRRLKGAAT